MSRESSSRMASAMSPFSLFTTMFMVCFLCEMMERWKHPGATLLFIALITTIVFSRVTRIKFFVFLLASSVYMVVFHFPEVNNHVNVFLMLSLGLILGILRSWFRPGSTDESFYSEMLPFLRIALVVLYSLAGFHKFNRDFFNPEVSCAGGMLLNGIIPMLQSTTLGLPSTLLLGMGVALLIILLRANFSGLRARPLLAFFLSLLFAEAAVLGLLLVALPGDVHIGPRVVAILATAGVTVSWELVGGLLLLVRRVQGPIVLFSFGMHATLALIGFVDFGSLAFTLLITFIPQNYLKLLSVENPSLNVMGFRVPRIHLYYLLLLVGGLLAGVHHRLSPVFGNIEFLYGMILDAAALLLLWPILVALFSSNRLPWKGVSVWTGRAPRTTAALVSLLLFHGLTPYLGLRTTGNFSMFSNLRTEGIASNHLLLGGNPFKIWGYQEDAVHFLEIDDQAAKHGYKYRPLKGQDLPVVEFRKLIHKWTLAGFVVPLTFEYRGQIHTTPDIVHDAEWNTPERSWEMMLMDFRVIQPIGANHCRW